MAIPRRIRVPGVPETGLTQESVQLAVRARFTDDFVRPTYEAYNFANLPGLIEQTLIGATDRRNFRPGLVEAVGESRHVVLLFVDAFGWVSYQQYLSESRLLQEFEKGGLVIKATAQFPSTTSAHVTTLHGGIPVYEHGLWEWHYFEPRVGEMISPLKFSFSEDTEPGTLERAGFSPAAVFPKWSFVEDLLKFGIDVRLYGPAKFTPSPYSLHLAPAKTLVPYVNLEEAVSKLLTNISAAKGSSYHVIYSDAFDDGCHEFGSQSTAAISKARAILKAFERIPAELPGDTTLIFTADHGCVDFDEDKYLAINQIVPDITAYLRKTASGKPLRFTGSSRDLFLHPLPEAQDELIAVLKKKLHGAARVYSVEECRAVGLLGPGPLEEEMLARLGTIAILPYPGYGVLWHEPPYFGHRLKASHGGASRQEMEIPLLFLKKY